MRLRAIEEGVLPSRSQLSIEKAIKEHFTPPKTHEHLLDLYISFEPRSGPPLSHYVFFWTSCATLHLDREPKDNRKGNSSIGNFRIRLQPDSYSSIGFVRLDFEWREKQPGMLEFVGIQMFCPRIVVKLGLMLITSCANTTPKAYTRVAAVHGRLEQEDWIIARPKQRLLALI